MSSATTKLPENAIEIPFRSLTFTKELNRGSFGAVWLGKFKKLVVAIKEQHFYGESPNSYNKDMEKSFLKEIRNLVNLKHKNIVKIFGYSKKFVGESKLECKYSIFNVSVKNIVLIF